MRGGQMAGAVTGDRADLVYLRVVAVQVEPSAEPHGIGSMEHILMMAQTAHQLRIVTCPAFAGWQDRLFDPPNKHRGWGDGRESAVNP